MGHIPSDLVVDRGVSDVEDSSALDFPVIHATSLHELQQHNLSNINSLKFYH